ncbi:Flavin-binding monooxygenase-like protein [Oesophagostomum dentatum]|uniref:Flavin-containing monooxygenase n=1 Tax=Oesophagostomum dentatum TaxID=61180 RepID=A0A0B1TIS7_OESDE|nr:Flavin-binding monooxygenase-like protein [Oesophagostomum dentatum]
MKRVAIVGAGPSGLPSARHALLYGFEPVVFEMSDKVGGLWNYKPQDCEEASVMKSTVINSSKEMSAYSDFPPRPEAANYMHNQKLLEYFQDYAEHYKLHRYIKFNHKVISTRKAADYLTTGKWLVEYTDRRAVNLSIKSDGGYESDTFDAVLLCTGHHKVPHWPEKWPGQESFKGRILHSHDYKEPTGYEGKRVVTVGIGNSGADIAVELSRVASQVFLSTRRGSWILNRMHTRGMPLDTCMSRRFIHSVLFSIPRPVRAWYVQRSINNRFDHVAYGLQPKHDIFGGHTTQNDELAFRLASGTVVVKPNIDRFTEHDVYFSDGSKVENIDYVVLSTGYDITFPDVENGELLKVDNNQVELYKYVFPLDQPHNTLGVIGLIQALGSIMPIAEMQARVFFSMLSGETKLPSTSEMRKDIIAKRESMKRQYVDSSRHTIQVDYIPFMDELATLIGCRPQFFPMIFQDTPLAMATTFGPCAPYVYRIDGPHKWEGAREAILNLPERVKCGMLPSYQMQPQRGGGISWPFIILGMLLMILPRILSF